METVDDPFVVLATIASRSTVGARGLPQQIDAMTTWSGIGFNLMGLRFVVPMTEVAELLERPGSTRIPGVKPWVKGVANVRGRLLPLVDLEVFFGGKLSGNRKRQRVFAIDIGELYSGVLVSEVFGMQHFPIDSYSANDTLDEAHKPFAPYLRGTYQNEQQSWTVFSLHELVKDPRFFNAAVH
ncbi:MAG: chemotaxis protein CheW [Pseudomonadales bacterium]